MPVAWLLNQQDWVQEEIKSTVKAFSQKYGLRPAASTSLCKIKGNFKVCSHILASTSAYMDKKSLKPFVAQEETTCNLINPCK